MQEPRPIETKSKVNTRADLAARLSPITLEPIRTSGKRGMDETSYSVATASAFVKSARDIPLRKKEPRLNHDELSSTIEFNGKSTLQQGTHAGVGAKDASFFSRARMEERKDDEFRHGLDTIPTRSGASRMQRTVDIMRKRENDPNMAPSKEEYAPIERRCPNGVPQQTKLETVRFTYALPQSSQQLDYRVPSHQLPTDINQTYTAQRRVISDCASSKDLFYATTKVNAEVLPGYMSHVPSDTKVLASLHGADDTLRQYAKSGHMSSAVPGSIADPMPARSSASKLATSQGFYLEQAVSSPSERELNRVKCGKKTAVYN